MAGGDESRDVIGDAARQVDGVDQRKQVVQIGRSQHRFERRRLAVNARHEDLLEHGPLDAGDVDLEHEPIQLRLG